MGAVISFLVIAIVVLLILSSCIRIVPQAQAPPGSPPPVRQLAK